MRAPRGRSCRPPGSLKLMIMRILRLPLILEALPIIGGVELVRAVRRERRQEERELQDWREAVRYPMAEAEPRANVATIRTEAASGVFCAVRIAERPERPMR